ncbi:MAG TPA: FkbM family methyltransferase [Bryobacteraceae bacterium]|nr:FkbM family methyltransferase [Bryobacteraceae bacterium]
MAVDVGAHQGLYSKLCATRFGSVAAIEPVPELANWLRHSLPDVCAVHQVAAGWRDGRGILRVPTTIYNRDYSLATLSLHNIEMSDTIGFVSVEVEERRLDTLLHTGDRRIAFIKIDCEGYENRVLEGTAHILAKDRPILLIEIEKRHNPEFQEVFLQLPKLGYSPYEFYEGGFHECTADVVEEAYGMLKRFNLLVGDNFSRRLEDLGLRYRNNFFFLPHC